MARSTFGRRAALGGLVLASLAAGRAARGQAARKVARIGVLTVGYTTADMAGSQPRSPTVRALDATETWVGLSGPGIDGPVTAVAATATDVIIGGSFSSISGVTVNGVARGHPGAWQPLGSGVLDGDVLAVAVMPNGDVVAGGTFNSAGGMPASNIA